MSERRRDRTFRYWRESEWADVATYLGPNAAKFRPVWEKTRERFAAGKAGVAWSWSWPALLVSFAWFFYRRQWWIGLALLVTPVALSLMLDRPPTGTLGVALVIAAMGKWAVVIDAVERIGRQRDIGGTVTPGGGVSRVGGLVGGIIYALALASALLGVASSS